MCVCACICACICACVCACVSNNVHISMTGETGMKGGQSQRWLHARV